MARYQPAERDARYRKALRAGRPPVLSEGDSWFDYPMYPNIIDQLDDERLFAIKRLEFSGDTVANMVGDGTSWRGLNSLKEVIVHERPRFLLFSGGGNDIVGNELTNAIKTYDPANSAEWHLDTAAWRALKRGVETGYKKLVDDVGATVPIVAHGYDYIIPANKKAKYEGLFGPGPWVWPEMQRAGVPDKMQVRIAKEMMDWFNEFLRDLAAKNVARFTYVDLRGTLAPKEWMNEIHPTRVGFKKVYAAFKAGLDRRLQPLLAAHDAEMLAGGGS
jgi:hypothetical protein